MQYAEYDTLRQMEDRHWWYAILHGLVKKEVERRMTDSAAILDAGCGTGGMMAKLRDQHAALAVDLHGIDASPLALSHCAARGLENISLGSVNALPYSDELFDAVLSLDVLYHERVDQQKALQEMRRVLKPGGRLILNLPAFDWLRGARDLAVCGVRRYTHYTVRQMLRSASLEIEMIHYWNAWLLLPLLLRRWLHRGNASDLHLPPKWLNTSLSWLGRMDASICRKLHVPFGSSIFVVAKRP